MRVEGQRMPTDFLPMKSGGDKPSVDNEKKPEVKVSLKELKKDTSQSKEVLQEAVKTANEAIKIINYHLQFTLHKDSGRYAVKVIDTATEEVIREIPPESVLEFSANIRKMLKEAIGVLVDEKV